MVLKASKLQCESPSQPGSQAQSSGGLLGLRIHTLTNAGEDKWVTIMRWSTLQGRCPGTQVCQASIEVWNRMLYTSQVFSMLTVQLFIFLFWLPAGLSTEVGKDLRGPTGPTLLFPWG